MNRTKLITGFLCAGLITGCATLTPQERAQEKFNEGQEKCAEMARGGNRPAAFQCMLNLAIAFHIPVNCMTQWMEGKQAGGQICMAEAAQKRYEEWVARTHLEQIEETRYRSEKAERLSKEFSTNVNAWAASMQSPVFAPKERQPVCTTLTHLNGFGNSVTETDCR